MAAVGELDSSRSGHDRAGAFQPLAGSTQRRPLEAELGRSSASSSV
jgi:hypothetical protein